MYYRIVIRDIGGFDFERMVVFNVVKYVEEVFKGICIKVIIRLWSYIT